MGWREVLRTALRALLAHIEGGGTKVTFWNSLTTQQKAAIRTALEAAAAERPRLVTVIKHLINAANVPITCWKVGEDRHPLGHMEPRICRNGRLYGVGVGGTQTFTPDPAIHEPWPSDGPHADWPAQIARLKTEVGGDLRLVQLLIEEADATE